MNQKPTPILLIICILVMIGVCVGLFVFRKSLDENSENKAPRTTKEVVPPPTENPPVTSDAVEKEPQRFTIKEIIPNNEFESSGELTKNLEFGLSKIESSEDLALLLKEFGATELSEEQLKDLYSKIGKHGENLQEDNFTDEIGELERRKRARWAINLKDGKRIFFDIKKLEDGSWKIEKIHDLLSKDSHLEEIIDEGNIAQLDGLIVAHTFVQFAIQQKFQQAKKLVDPSKMSDVQLAGLCIIFDEGGYKLREPRGVLMSYDRLKVAGCAVHVSAEDGSLAQFSLVMMREDAAQPWRVVELNFNSLLMEFIKSNGGDSYYTPFVKSPQGGDSIVVYFDFNDQQLSGRTQRQLKIVASILKLDEKKKLTLTGHTDAVGGDAFNKQLSQRRANAVRDFLVSEGVKPEQVKTIGFGKYRPREANTLKDGTDNPDGRRANRRTEIYLDF